MNKLLSFVLIIAALVLQVQCQSNAVCITQNNDGIRLVRTGATSFNDFVSLTQQSQTSLLKLQSVSLCSNTTSKATISGIYSTVVSINPITNAITNTTNTTNAGNFKACQTILNLNVNAGEYVSSVNFQNNTNGLVWINLTTNLNQTAFQGTRATTNTNQVISFDSTNQLLGFWGANFTNIITSISTVSVNSTCSPVVIQESVYTQPSQPNQISTGAIVGIVIGCVAAVVITITISVAFYMKHRKQNNKTKIEVIGESKEWIAKKESQVAPANQNAINKSPFDLVNNLSQDDEGNTIENHIHSEDADPAKANQSPTDCEANRLTNARTDPLQKNKK